MREKFVFFVLIPLLIVVTIVYLFIDRWIESGLEYAGEQIVGAKVEIDKLRLSLSPIGIEFARLQVADPDDGWKNLFETGRVKFAMDFGQLLRGKFVIETMEVNELIFGTKRTTDGSLPKPKVVAEIEKEPETSKSQTVSFDIERIKKELKIDSLLDPDNLLTYKFIDTLKNQINEANIQWKNSLDEIGKTQTKLTDIETQASSIKVGEIKNLQQAVDALNRVKEILKTANEIKSTFTESKSTLTSNINKLSGSVRKIDDVVEEDYQRIKRLARFPDLSTRGIAEMVIGKDLVKQIFVYIGYTEKAKKYIKNSSSKPEIEKPKRFNGQDIHFPAPRAYPKLWIKKILISGGTDQKQNPRYFYARGKILNITNDQRITGQPLIIDLLATRGGLTSLSLNAVFDRTKEPGVDTYEASLTGLPIKQLSFGSSNFLPSKMQEAIADAIIKVVVPGNKFDANTKLIFKNAKFIFEREPTDIFEKVAQDVMKSLNDFHVGIRIWRDEKKFDIAFTTDIDDKLALRAKQIIGAEIEKLQREVKAKLNEKIAEKRKEVEKIFNEKKDMVMNKLKDYENQFNEKLVLIENKKKELENRIEQEKKKQGEELKQKGKDILKDVFKK